MHFTYSTAALIEHSKNLFVSEEFAEAILHLQLGLSHDGSMTPELILSLLKSEIGYNIVDIDDNKTEVEFHKDFIVPEYFQFLYNTLFSSRF